MGFKGEALNLSFFLSANFVRTLITNVDNDRKLSGGRSPPLKEQRMLRALPLKPMRDSVPQPCEPLKRLERNFLVSKICALANWEFIGNFVIRGNKLI